ncbi:hypothetical protein PENSPDRAFT_693318 [Peniophora sp. CONT]|nr:hypothetical protein PENSPDRAFT_693318 [Peniophora sp. CONT]
MTYNASDSACLQGLPVELISEIAIFGQLIWLEEKCKRRTSTPGTLRSLPLVLNQDDCRGVTAGLVEECLADKPILSPEPAHALMDTNSRLRQVLHDNKTVWRQANTLLSSNARLSGERSRPPPELAAVGAQFSYPSDTFVGENICYCPFIRYIEPFYPTLRVVKISMPWADFMQPDKTSMAYFFCRHHSQDFSPLEFFDVELHEDIYVSPEFLLAYRSPAIQTCRVRNMNVFFYGPLLKELEIAFPFGNRHYFGPGLLNALDRCSNLQLFTFMGGSCEMIEVALGNAFDDEIPPAVHLPTLRYLRLLLPADVVSQLLPLMILPACVDIHLEPVLSWRAAASLYVTAGQTSFISHAGASSGTHHLWQYAATLAAPARAPAAFEVPPQFEMPTGGQEADILRSMSTVAMDIRFNPATWSPLHEIQQFPEVIGFSLGRNVEDVVLPLENEIYALSTPSAMHGARVRRSIAVRNEPTDMESARSWPESFGYAAIRQVALLLMDGQAKTPYPGLGVVNSFVVVEGSWLPGTPSAWGYVLEAFDGITELIIRATDVASLESLAIYLQGQRDSVPVRRLQIISLPQCSALDEPTASLCRRLNGVTNTEKRLASGAAVLCWIIGA